ncbi:MAG: hypothetical protein EBQ56_15415 [Proteobacteria bacterium]|nr:hypothetical protein [Pseudomonadota bacterium]NBY49127.1 hypothetical protein [Pseudomonadota bacterium]
MPEPASPLDRQDPVGPPLTFDRTEGRIQHRFLRAHGTAAHVALTSGVAPRIIIAFPAGNRGVLLQGRIHNADVALAFDGPLTPLDEETHGIQGVAVTIITDAPELRFAPAVLGNIRTIRDVGYGARLIPRLRRYSIAVTGTASDRALTIERPGLDGRHAYAIQVEPRDGTTVTVDPDGGFTLHPPPTGQVCADIVATCDDPHLTPIPVDRLLRPSARARLTGTDAHRDLNALAFLAYREKLLAGSWQYLTYFGRDTLLALRLLAPAIGADLFEAGLGAVIDRMAPTGDVAHEESLGEYALMERDRARKHARQTGTAIPDHVSARGHGRSRTSPLLDYKMVDDDFLLAPVLAHYLLDTPDDGATVNVAGSRSDGASRARAFLGRRTPTGLTYADAIRQNLETVIERARPYATSQLPRDLIHLRQSAAHVDQERWGVGNWRDSSDGLGGGVVPFDVNVALVPAALRDAARLLDTGWFTGATDDQHERGSTLADDARALASAWTGTDRHFTVTINSDRARANLTSIGHDRGLPTRFITDALGTISDEPVTFPGIALDAEGKPVPVMHGDDSLVLLFGDPSPDTLHQIADRLTAPFPAGLRLPGAGTLVANPVHAGEDLRARFTAGHYHGTVIWSWPQAAYAAGIARQIDRPDLPATTRARLIAAEAILWQGIEASDALRTSEFWTYTIDDEGACIPVPAQGAGIVNESNPVQLWSTVYLAIHPPAR